MKRLLTLMLTVALALSLVACSGESANDTRGNSDESVTPAIGEPQNTAEATLEEDNADTPTPESNAEVKKDVPVPSVSETISVDDKCEFYLDYVNITNDVMPPQPGNWYSHYEADDGKVYVDVCVAYKNLATRNIDADESNDRYSQLQRAVRIQWLFND